MVRCIFFLEKNKDERKTKRERENNKDERQKGKEKLQDPDSRMDSPAHYCPVQMCKIKKVSINY